MFLILEDKVLKLRSEEAVISFAYNHGLSLEAFGPGEFRKAESHILRIGGKLLTEEEALLFVGVKDGVTRIENKDLTDGYKLGEDVWFDLCHALFPKLSIYKFKHEDEHMFLFATDMVSAHKRIEAFKKSS